MTRTLFMVNRKIYNLNANEGFEIFLTSKLLTCFIGDFTSTMIPKSIAHLLIGNEHIYWILGPWGWSALTMGFVGKWPSRMQEQWASSISGGRATVFGSTSHRIWSLQLVHKDEQIHIVPIAISLMIFRAYMDIIFNIRSQKSHMH